MHTLEDKMQIRIQCIQIVRLETILVDVLGYKSGLVYCLG